MESLTVSVMIPTRNECRYIDRCLESVMAMDKGGQKVEIIVIDGMSTDGTRDKLRLWAEKGPDFILLDNPQKIVPTALNIGLRHSKGDLVVRLDAHSVYQTDYLVQCIETMQRTGADNVGGVVVPMFSTNSLPGRLVAALTSHRFGVGNSHFRTSTVQRWVDTVPFGCFRRNVFDRVGFFDERLVRNQDNEMNKRILALGGRIWLNPDIRIQYANRDTLIGLLRQASQNGKWNVWTWYLAPHAFSLRHAIPALFLMGLGVLFSAGVLIGSSLSWVPILLLALAYSAAALSASVAQSMVYGPAVLPFLPFCFLTYHITYGLGSWNGLIQLLFKRSPVQVGTEPWVGCGRYRVI